MAQKPHNQTRIPFTMKLSRDSNNHRASHALVNHRHKSFVYDGPMAKRQERTIDPAETARSVALLVAIADLGSFTSAAAHLTLTPSAISKAVARTEARLGVRLLSRTTRSVALTDDGAAYVAHGRKLLAELETLDREAAARTQTVSGTLRIAAPTVYGAVRIAPVVAMLQKKHDALDVQLRCDDRMLDIIAERIDVAIRMLASPPAEFVSRALCDDRRGLYASPGYLRRARPPKTVDDLVGHSAIMYSGSSATAAQLRSARVVFATDSVLAAREAARAGIGIVELAEYLAVDDLAAGTLREVLPNTVPVVRKIYAVYLPSRYLPPRIRVFVDALVDDARRR
jgi:DNA-binding transcriptional LysR family regulator